MCIRGVRDPWMPAPINAARIWAARKPEKNASKILTGEASPSLAAAVRKVLKVGSAGAPEMLLFSSRSR
jgi:hypothetical protein